MANDLMQQFKGIDHEGRQDRLRALTSAFAELIAQQGMGGDECHQICEERIVIGPNGEPHREVVCRMVCR
jgi:hypothetical protein